jgi:hypothetical protein
MYTYLQGWSVYWGWALWLRVILWGWYKNGDLSLAKGQWFHVK